MPEIDRGFLPDLVVICRAPAEDPSKPGAVTNPSIVFEVLSASTHVYDRTTKLEAYQRLPSLQAYVLLHQHGSRAEVFRRDPAHGWTSEERSGGSVELPGGLLVDLDIL